jgi:glycosyltransferase involved in cell wall biosynthesis
MKIAYVTQPWDGIGGGSSLGILTCNLLKRLSVNNETMVFCKTGKCNFENSDRIKYYYYESRFDYFISRSLKAFESYNPKKNHLIPYFSLNLYFFFYSFRIAVKLFLEKAEVVHIHNFSQFINIIRFINPKIKIILHMHCEWLSQLNKKMIRRRIKKADIIIGCSQYIRNKIINVFPDLEYKITSVPNATEIREIKKESPAVDNRVMKILFVGRISPEKGVHTLIEIFNKVVKEIPSVQLDLAGAIKTLPKDFIIKMDQNPAVAGLSRFYNEKSYYEQLVSFIDPAAMNKIKFHNHLNQAKLSEFYQQADIVVNPSISESFGMAVIEANSYGLPVIVSNIGGMDELVQDGVNGYKIDPSDINLFYKRIIELLTDDDKRNAMGKNGEKLIKEFYNWERVSSELECIYKSEPKRK